MDTIGAIETAHDFMVAGTAPDSLYGMCESMWKPDLVRLFTLTHQMWCTNYHQSLAGADVAGVVAMSAGLTVSCRNLRSCLR